MPCCVFRQDREQRKLMMCHAYAVFMFCTCHLTFYSNFRVVISSWFAPYDPQPVASGDNKSHSLDISHHHAHLYPRYLIFSRFIRNLQYFYKPSSQRFCTVHISDPQARTFSEVGCLLIDFLLASEDVRCVCSMMIVSIISRVIIEILVF